MGTWVDLWTLLRRTALGRLPSQWSIAATCFSGCRGYLHCGLALNWAGLAVYGSLTHGPGCSGVRFGAVLQWEWRHWCCVLMPTPGHARQHVRLAYNRLPSYRCTCITPGTSHTMVPSGLTVLCSTVPPIANTAQSDRILQCPSVSCASPPLGQLPRAVCPGLFSAFCDPTSLLICHLASQLQRLASSRYSIPTQHSFPLTHQLTCASIALSILRRTTFLIDLWVD